MPEARTVKTTVTFLQMTARPHHPHPPVPHDSVAILHAIDPPLHFYRYLYGTIGRDYTWVIRKRLNDAELAKIVKAQTTELYVLYAHGVPAGMAELDFAQEGKASLAYFGLMPEFIGQRYGAYFLHQAIEIAWDRGIESLLVNTCTLDHPRALPLYQRMGFSPYAQEEQELTLAD